MAENCSGKTDDVPRPDIINTAVNFLQNPTVQRSSLKHRHAFLKSKGLSDEEIRIACEKSNMLIENQKTKLSGPLTQTPNGVSPVLSPQTHSSWERFRDFSNTVVLIGGVTYGIYILYKKYVLPLLSGGKGDKKSIEQSISELDLMLATSVQELRDSLNKVHADIKSFHESQPSSSTEAPATVKQIEDLKSEIASVKGLLLNRSQFAAPVVTKSPLTPPSIPVWQLTATENAKETEDSSCNKGDADIEDICLSGSGSSETEMITNNGSDSSLEMIRE